MSTGNVTNKWMVHGRIPLGYITGIRTELIQCCQMSATRTINAETDLSAIHSTKVIYLFEIP